MSQDWSLRVATSGPDPSVFWYTRIARRVRLGFAGAIGATFIALLSYEKVTHGLQQSGVTELLGALLMVVPVLVLCFFVIDVVMCIASAMFSGKDAAERETRRHFGRALAETLLTPALVYLEILAAAWLRSR